MKDHGWLLVMTKPQQEAKADKHLRNQGYVVVYARCRRDPQAPIKPLYPRYLFVEYVHGVTPVAPIHSTFGCCGPVMTGQRITIVSDHVVDAIRAKMTEEDGTVVPLAEVQAQRFEKGQKLRLHEGPFTGHAGLFDEDEGKRVRVLVDIFGRTVPVSVPMSTVEALAADPVR